MALICGLIIRSMPHNLANETPFFKVWIIWPGKTSIKGPFGLNFSVPFCIRPVHLFFEWINCLLTFKTTCNWIYLFRQKKSVNFLQSVIFKTCWLGCHISTIFCMFLSFLWVARTLLWRLLCLRLVITQRASMIVLKCQKGELNIWCPFFDYYSAFSL